MTKTQKTLLTMAIIGTAFTLWIVPIWADKEEVNQQIGDLVFVNESQVSVAEQLCDCKLSKLADKPIYLKLYDPSAPNIDWHNFRDDEACGLIVTDLRTNLSRSSVSTRVAGHPFTATGCKKLKDLSKVFISL
jgi:hypothetical protein